MAKIDHVASTSHPQTAPVIKKNKELLTQNISESCIDSIQEYCMEVNLSCPYASENQS
jgi:hypothetical protein